MSVETKLAIETMSHQELAKRWMSGMGKEWSELALEWMKIEEDEDSETTDNWTKNS